jgi:hypothetical protein
MRRIGSAVRPVEVAHARVVFGSLKFDGRFKSGRPDTEGTFRKKVFMFEKLEVYQKAVTLAD